jgi:anti-sigma B factor antagonist
LTVTSPQRPASATQHDRRFIVTHPTEKTCVIAVTCELDVVTTPTLDQLITQELDSRRALLLLDLAGCDFMGSSGLAVLMSAREHSTDTPTRFALAGLNRTVTRALQAVGLEALFDIYPTTPAALSSLSGE